MLSKYIQLKFTSTIIPNSLQEKAHGGTVMVAGGIPAGALNIEFEALRVTGTILGYAIGGALDKCGEPIKGVYQICWWNPPQKNSNNTKRTKHP